MNTKDYSKWKWEVIGDLIEGPLNNNTLLNYILTKTAWMKKLLKFWRPSVKAFSKMSWTPVFFIFFLFLFLHFLFLLLFLFIKKQNLKYVRLACQLFQLLLSSDLGKDFLFNENKLLNEVADLIRLEVEYVK